MFSTCVVFFITALNILMSSETTCWGIVLQSRKTVLFYDACMCCFYKRIVCAHSAHVCVVLIWIRGWSAICLRASMIFTICAPKCLLDSDYQPMLRENKAQSELDVIVKYCQATRLCLCVFWTIGGGIKRFEFTLSELCKVRFMCRGSGCLGTIYGLSICRSPGGEGIPQRLRVNLHSETVWIVKIPFSWKYCVYMWIKHRIVHLSSRYYPV